MKCFIKAFNCLKFVDKSTQEITLTSMNCIIPARGTLDQSQKEQIQWTSLGCKLPKSKKREGESDRAKVTRLHCGEKIKY